MMGTERQAKDGTFYKQVGQDEWTPVTREAKDGTIYKKVGVDDWTPLVTESVPQTPQSKSLGESALELVSDFGKKVDSYTGAPTRSAIGALQDGKNPITAFGKQFGENPDLAPTGKEIAEKAGASTKTYGELLPEDFYDVDMKADFPAMQAGQAQMFKNVSPAGAAGLAIDVTADPTLIIPGKAISKTVEAGGNAARFLTKEGASLAGKAANKVGNVTKAVVTKTGSTLTGLPEKTIKTYIDQRKAVDGIISKYGGDMSLAADELRENLQSAIRSKIGSLNSEIKKAIQEAPTGSFKANEAIIKGLTDVRDGLNPNLYPESVAEINEIVKKIQTLPPELSAVHANEAKLFLQDQAKGSYIKGGQLFTTGKDASKAAKLAGREARKAEMALAPGTVAPNMDLARLHRYQENVNKNLVAPGKSESALITAGSGANARNVKNLNDIGNITGYDALGDAEKLSAAKTFANPPILPTDATGKTLARMGAAYYLGGPIALAFTSPAVLKQAIRVGDVSTELIKKLSGGATSVTDDVLKKVVEAAKTKNGQMIIKASGFSPRTVGLQSVAGNEPTGGYEKWAQDGVQKLQSIDKEGILKNPEIVEKIKRSREGKDLLIRASRKDANIEQIFKKIKTSYLNGDE
jgi:hypothetical protein